MKLTDLAARKPSQQTAKVFESYFDKQIDLDRLNRRQTAGMLKRVQSLLSEHRGTTARHHSEKDANYLKLVMMEQALAQRLSEMTPPQPTATATATPGAAAAGKPVDPKLKAAQDKLAKKQPLTPEEQDLINANAAAVTEDRLRRAYRMLKESEVQQAQVVLAAQDMVDKMQGMLEDVSELQFKELPALVDSIKNQVGIDQAQQFNTDATAALTGLLQNIQGAKQQLDAALGVVTGQAPAGGALADVGAAADATDAAAGDLGAVGDIAAEPVPSEEPAPVEEPGEEPATGTLGRAKR